MREGVFIVIAAAVGLAVWAGPGCTVGFDPDRAFPCKSDDDCLPGQQCGSREKEPVCMRRVDICVVGRCDAGSEDALPVVGDGGVPVDGGPNRDAGLPGKDAAWFDAAPPVDALVSRDVPITAPDAEPPEPDALPPAQNCPQMPAGGLAIDCTSQDGLCLYEFDTQTTGRRIDCTFLCDQLELGCARAWDDHPDYWCRPTNPLDCDTRGWTLICGCVPPGD